MNRRYRKTIIAGNWKMNMTASDTKKFADDIKAIMPRAKWCDVVVCVPFVNIPAALKASGASGRDGFRLAKSGFRYRPAATTFL